MDFDQGFGDGKAVERDLLLGIVRVRAGPYRLSDDGDGQRIDEGGERGGVEDGRFGLRAALGAEGKAGGSEGSGGEKAAAGDLRTIIQGKQGSKRKG